MKKLMFFIITSLLAVTLLSGCSYYTSDVNKLMNPPKPTGIRQEVQQLIYQVAGNDISYSYPKNGVYRSAIIESEDITGDGKNDILGFYETPDDSGGITLIILSSSGGSWQVLAKYESIYTCVDRVCFGDLDGDNIKDIIIGWGSPVNQHGSICTYHYCNEKIAELDLGDSYAELAVGDFIKSQPGDELLVTELFRTEQKEDGSILEHDATASLYQIENTRYVCYSKTSTDKTFVRYVSSSVGTIYEGTLAFVIDGAKADNTVQTEILYWNERTHQLTAYPTVRKTNMESTTLRSAAANVWSRDINRDGILEIPTVTLLPCIEDDPTQPCYQISWNRFDVSSQELLLVMNTVFNSEYGYYFQLPEKWWDKITVRSTGNTVFIYELNSKNQQTNNILLKIMAYSEEDWKEISQNNLIQLARQSGYVYAAILPNKSGSINITEEELKGYFNLLV